MFPEKSSKTINAGGCLRSPASLRVRADVSLCDEAWSLIPTISAIPTPANSCSFPHPEMSCIESRGTERREDPCRVGQRESAWRVLGPSQQYGWCRGGELNSLRRPFQGRALPVSYPGTDVEKRLYGRERLDASALEPALTTCRETKRTSRSNRQPALWPRRSESPERLRAPM